MASAVRTTTVSAECPWTTARWCGSSGTGVSQDARSKTGPKRVCTSAGVQPARFARTLTSSALISSQMTAYSGDTNFAPSSGTVIQTVNGPAVTLSPTSVSFGNQALNETSAAKTVTLTNNLSTALTISSITD